MRGCGNVRKTLSKHNTEGFFLRNESLGIGAGCLEMFFYQERGTGTGQRDALKAQESHQGRRPDKVPRVPPRVPPATAS